jgi:hypothetical protein
MSLWVTVSTIIAELSSASSLLVSFRFSNFLAVQDVSGLEQFREFTNFLDGIGLSAEWSPYINLPNLDEEDTDTDLRSSQGIDDPATPSRNPRPETPFSYWLPTAPEQSNLPPIHADSRRLNLLLVSLSIQFTLFPLYFDLSIFSVTLEV